MCVPVFCVGVSFQIIWVNNCTMNTGQCGKPILGGVCLVTESCLTLCNPMDCGPPGSSVYGIFQARILEWVAISYSRGSSWPKDGTCVSCIGRQILYHSAPTEYVSFNFMAAIIICSDFGDQENKVCHCFPIYFPWSGGTGCHDLRFLNVEL